MTAPPPNRRLVGLAAAVVVALTTLLGPSVAAPVAAGPGQLPEEAEAPAAPAPPPTMELVQRPRWVGADDEVAFAVRLGGDLTEADVRLRIHAPLDDVDDLETSASEDVGTVLFRTPTIPIGFLAPGPDGTSLVGLRTTTGTADQFTARLTSPGVHPVVITLLDDDGTVAAEVRTPVVRLEEPDEDAGGEPVAPALELAVLLDLGAGPTLQPDGTRTLADRTLATAGEVGRLVAAHPDAELSVAAVPDTLDALGASADPNAATVLADLAGADALALPYLPLPIKELRRLDLVSFAPPLIERGTTVVADRLGTEPRTGIWDPAADIGPEGERLLDELDHDLVIVPTPDPAEGDDSAAGDEEDPDALPVDPTALDPTALVDAGPSAIEGRDGLAALVVDDRLSAALARNVGDGVDAPHVAMARLLLRADDLAERAVAEPPDPDDDDTVDDGPAPTVPAEDGVPEVLVRPGAAGAASLLVALVDLLDAPASPIRVGGLDLLDDDIDPRVDPITWDGGAGPDLGEVASRVLEVRSAVDTFDLMIDGASSRADVLRLQLATAIGATTEPEARVAAVAAVEDTVNTTFDAIALAGQVDLNLTSRNGTLPVTVTNGNGFGVDVIIRIRSDRLRFPDGERLPVTVAGDEARIDVRVEALATGSVPVFVELWTGDDQRLLDSRQLNVRSTAISGVGLAISAGALLVLIVWWARSWRRARRNRAAEEKAAEEKAAEEKAAEEKAADEKAADESADDETADGPGSAGA